MFQTVIIRYNIALVCLTKCTLQSRLSQKKKRFLEIYKLLPSANTQKKKAMEFFRSLNTFT